MKGKRYGDTKTHLRLSGKAWDYYSNTDPCDIYEFKTDDGFRYSLDYMDNLTESELIEILEALADELGSDEE